MKFDSIDTRLVWGHEKVAHFTQRFVGLNCFHLAWLFATCALTLIVISVAMARIGTLSGGMGAAMVLSYMYGVATNQQKPGFRNSLQVFTPALVTRYFSVVGVVGSTLLLWLNDHRLPLHLLIMSGLYFGACSPLPPSETKIRKWLRSAQNWFKGKAVSPQLEPSVPQPI